MIDLLGFLKSESRKSLLLLFSLMVWSFLLPFFISVLVVVEMQGRGGNWEVMLENSGVSTMHMPFLPNSKVIIFDHIDFGPSNIFLHLGKFQVDQVMKEDCWAHSIEYVEDDFDRNQVHPFKFQWKHGVLMG